MDCIVALVVLVLGIVLLATGKMSFGSKEARGGLVRLGGLVMLLGPIIGFGIIFAIGFNEGLQAGLNAPGGKVNEQQLEDRLEKEINEKYWWVPLACSVGGAVLALVMVLASLKPKEETGRRYRRRRYEEDDEDDRDDRRRRYDDEDDRDRPRRRSDEEDEDEDDRDRPRRRSDDDR